MQYRAQHFKKGINYDYLKSIKFQSSKTMTEANIHQSRKVKSEAILHQNSESENTRIYYDLAKFTRNRYIYPVVLLLLPSHFKLFSNQLDCWTQTICNIQRYMTTIKQKIEVKKASNEKVYIQSLKRIEVKKARNKKISIQSPNDSHSN